jgi:hypothetical protein
MSTIIKYAVYNDIYLPIIDNRKISPLDTLSDCYAPDVVVEDLSEKGFSSKSLKNSGKYPHSLICLSIDSTKNVAGAGLTNTPIEDAINMGLAAWGGREITAENAVLFAKDIYPAGSSTDFEGRTVTWTDPYIGSDGIIMRDITIS